MSLTMRVVRERGTQILVDQLEQALQSTSARI
jgi:hypothetical protein